MPQNTQMPALGYVGLGQYLDANRGVLGDQLTADQKRAADTLAGGDQTAEQNLGRSFGSEAALAGSGGKDPTSGANAFNAALEWGANGPQYKTLAEQLDAAANVPRPAPVGTSLPIQTDPNGQQRLRPTPAPPPPTGPLSNQPGTPPWGGTPQGGNPWAQPGSPPPPPPPASPWPGSVGSPAPGSGQIGPPLVPEQNRLQRTLRQIGRG